MAQVDTSPVIELSGNLAIGIVIGTSCFGILWGIINAVLVSAYLYLPFLTINKGY